MIIPLARMQMRIMKEFYYRPKTKVVFTKTERQALWDKAKNRDNSIDFISIKSVCPALEHQIRKSYDTGHNIQSAIFSECVYAQTFANMFSLNLFVNCTENNNFIPEKVINLLSSYQLHPRYVYATSDKTRMLIQAGGCNGIDSALISVMDLDIYTIEFKEPGAKTSEPDLPKYKEDGKLLITDEFLLQNPQFKEMLSEQKMLNFFDVMGSNVNNFSLESINIAVTNNYSSKKYADVICTEDKNGYLVMIPSNQISKWAKIEGEIRPAGRNNYKVWTPNALKKFLSEKGAVVSKDMVNIKKANLIERKQRGGCGQVSGYKINSLFFIRSNVCKIQDERLLFNINDVRQLNPTITAKVFFKNLKYDEVKKYYKL